MKKIKILFSISNGSHLLDLNQYIIVIKYRYISVMYSAVTTTKRYL
jgi:hypothetical protein